jgi:hypothetical protein
MTSIDSRARWNDTKIHVLKGHRYAYRADGEWVDWFYICDAAGHSLFYLKPFSVLKRVKTARWCQLVACVDKDSYHPILLGCSGSFAAPASGRLWAFANDAPFGYQNNRGAISLSVHPLY